jgi:hypothetical protein
MRYLLDVTEQKAGGEKEQRRERGGQIGNRHRFEKSPVIIFVAARASCERFGPLVGMSRGQCDRVCVAPSIGGRDAEAQIETSYRFKRGRDSRP